MDNMNNRDNNELNEPQMTDFGFTEVLSSDKSKLVANVFNNVSKKYDLMNNIMSLGLHHFWKKFTTLSININKNAKILDLAGGTADMVVLFNKLINDDGEIWHTDININMLKIGREKLYNEGILATQCICDAEQLPFNNNYFDVVSIAFGLRNMTNKGKVLKEIYRALNYGGSLIVLEFSKIYPTLIPLYNFYLLKILPLMGKMIAHDEDSYKYLAESINIHPDQETVKTMFVDAGFSNVKYYNLSLGIVALHIGYKI